MAYTPKLINSIARLCHEVNRQYCYLLGDNSQAPWEHTSESIKASARNGVQFVMQNPDAPPSASHDNWLKFKEAEGWQYGPVKDLEKKEHPCFVPYEELPETQRLKDALFRNTVLAFVSTITSSEPYESEDNVTEQLNQEDLNPETKEDGEQLPLPLEGAPSAEGEGESNEAQHSQDETEDAQSAEENETSDDEGTEEESEDDDETSDEEEEI